MTALAMKQPGLKPATKIVLYWLAEHHNGETGACFPSLKTLERKCEMNRSTVVRHLEALEQLGLIKRNRRERDNGSQTSTAYILHLPPVAERNSPCGKTQQAPVAKRDPHNLGNINLGIEPEDDHRDAAIKADQPAQGGLIQVSEPPLEGNIGSDVAKASGGLREGCLSIEEEFERVWEHYPRKVGKGAARKAWAKARKRATYAEVTGPLGVWIKLQRGTPVEKTPHFTTWLNQERWLDDQTHARNRAETTTDRLNRLGSASTEDRCDAIARPRRTPPQIELRMDPWRQ
ncbi:helix-turn-helix domain-containing protein [Thalassobacter stenotrophicus]|uniref:Helix-turn-helix domain-containing protein n=2 Tax=Thalassobacter stenotrophicus TaxID=266809 RepID=A0A0P1EZB4_9RHOB|nr:helix-turn-helix domain-containing protein [Thalassobacter stenotrophicus]CUH60259.1 hypothetical protein THS5294_01548 [Thalassobacter stenotrophicus]SHI71381.1 Helix-turn-helix domain-containing protein [Thalassobacter stenotrophicus DSM 16310]